MFEQDAETPMQKLLFAAAVAPVALVVLMLAEFPRSPIFGCIYLCFALPIALLSLLIAAVAFIGFNLAKIVDPVVELAYRGLRKAIFPVRYANDHIERRLMNAETSRATVNYINFMLMLEMGVEITLMHALVFTHAPRLLQAFLTIYNFSQVNEWRNDRLNKLENLLYAQRRFDLGMLERNVMPMQQHYNPEQRPQALSSDATFAKAWKKAIKQHDLAEALEILQTTYARNGRIQFTAEMQRSLDKVDARLRNGLTPAELNKLESSYPNLKTCPLTCAIMWLPVILTSNNHDHHFEFIYLLKCFQDKNVHPTTRERITDLRKIRFADDAYRDTQVIIEKTKNIWSEASRSNDYAPILEYLQSMAKDAREDAKTILCENVKYITDASNKFINGNDNYFGTLISPKVFNRLANDPANKFLLCELSAKFMRNPVYIDLAGSDGAFSRHYFDLVPLLNWLMISDKMPIFGVDQKLEFHDINYDTEKRREVKDTLRANLVKVILFSQRKGERLGIESDVTSDEESDLEPAPPPARQQRRRSRSKSNERFNFS